MVSPFLLIGLPKRWVISFLVMPTSTLLIRVEESVDMQLVANNADKLNPNRFFSAFLMIDVFKVRSYSSQNELISIKLPSGSAM